MGSDSKEILKDVTFANWNSFYNDLFEEINQIRKIGAVCLFKPAEVTVYYSRIVNLFSTVQYAIGDTNTMNNDLKEIEKNIFSPRYNLNLKHKKINDYQRKVLSNLRDIFTVMCNDLSEHGLLPKINKRNKYDPKRAISHEVY